MCLYIYMYICCSVMQCVAACCSLAVDYRESQASQGAMCP